MSISGTRSLPGGGYLWYQGGYVQGEGGHVKRGVGMSSGWVCPGGEYPPDMGPLGE